MYLKEHLIPLAKDKNDKIFESDVTLQITRSLNKDVWNCEEEVKQLLSKTESRSVMISCIIDHVIINYSQNAQSLYIGFFIADKIAYEYGIECKLDTFIKRKTYKGLFFQQRRHFIWSFYTTYQAKRVQATSYEFRCERNEALALHNERLVLRSYV